MGNRHEPVMQLIWQKYYENMLKIFQKVTEGECFGKLGNNVHIFDFTKKKNTQIICILF